MHVSPILSIEEYQKLKDNPQVKTFDVRGQWGLSPKALKSEYLKGHIPGAQFIDWMQDFLEPHKNTAMAPVANFETAQRSFEKLGIHGEDTVVLYDDSQSLFAARTWWAMTYWGHPQVKILDGGWGRWQQLGLETSSGEGPSPGLGSFQPLAREDWLVDTAKVKDSLGKAHLLDSRGSKGFTKGHIELSLIHI